MSGIFNIIAVALRRLTKTQRVHVNEKTIKQRREKAQLIRDPVKAFLEDAIMKTADLEEYETKDHVYEAYTRFCNFHKSPREGDDTFGDILREKYEYKKCRRTINGKRRVMGWKGIHLIKWTGRLADPFQKTLTDDDEDDGDENE